MHDRLLLRTGVPTPSKPPPTRSHPLCSLTARDRSDIHDAYDYPSPPPEIQQFLRGKPTYGKSAQRQQLWQFYQPLLARLGYSVAWEGDVRHDSNHFPDADDPWHPKSGQSFAAATLGRRGLRWAGPTYWPVLCGIYDQENRFAVVKIVDSTSSELAVLLKLSKTRDPGNHTIPVLAFIITKEWSLVIMPAWELNIYSHPCWNPTEYLDIALQCLEGLSYMHGMLIAHLDIYSLNVVLNHVAFYRGKANRPFLSKFNAKYAFIDFGYSVMFEPTTDRSQRLIHGSQLPMTYREIPGIKVDGSCDPFAADMYAMAKTLYGQFDNDKEQCEQYWSSRSPSDDLPRIAPEYLLLLNKMMDNDPAKRPTARTAFKELKLIRQVAATRV